MFGFSFGKLSRGLVVAALALVVPAIGHAFPVSTGANAACTSASLATYQGLGFAGCTVGAATFYNFTSTGTVYDNSFTPLPTLPNFQAAGITITPGSGPLPSITFSSPTLFNLLTGYASYTIEYYVDPPIDILGFGLDDAPFSGSDTYVSAEVCTDDTFANNCPRNIDAITESSFIRPQAQAAAFTTDYYTEIDSINSADFAPFDHTTQFLDVIVTISLDARDGPTSIPSFSNTPQVAIPEPSELALSGVGGLMLLGTMLRTRRRAKKASLAA